MKTPYEQKIEREDFWIELLIWAAVAVTIGALLA